MRLIFVRHAPSEGYFIRDDEEADFLREITIEGKKEFTRTTLKALRKNFKLIDVIFTSPLVRAIQTAEMISAEVLTAHFAIHRCCAAKASECRHCN